MALRLMTLVHVSLLGWICYTGMTEKLNIHFYGGYSCSAAEGMIGEQVHGLYARGVLISRMILRQIRAVEGRWAYRRRSRRLALA